MSSSADTDPGRLSVVGLGWALYDNLILADEYPAENTKQAAELWCDQAGGPTVRAMMAVARLGGTASVITAVGDDHAGEAMRLELRANGVDVSQLQTQTGGFTRRSSVWLSRGTGSRTISYTTDGPDLEPLGAAASQLIERAQVLHLDGREKGAALWAAAEAVKYDTVITIDVGSVKDGIASLVELANLVIISDESLREVSGQSEVSAGAHLLLRSPPTETVIVSAGVHGSSAYLASGESFEVPAFAVDAVDTNGAGDVFAGALVWGLAHELPIDQNLRQASACAAIKCSRLGNVGLPTLTEVLEMANRDG